MGYLLIDRDLDFCLLQVHVDLFWPYGCAMRDWDSFEKHRIHVTILEDLMHVECSVDLNTNLTQGLGVLKAFPILITLPFKSSIYSTTSFPRHSSMAYWRAMNAEHRSKCETLRRSALGDVYLRMKNSRQGGKITNYQRLRRCCDMYVKDYDFYAICWLVYAVCCGVS